VKSRLFADRFIKNRIVFLLVGLCLATVLPAGCKSGEPPVKEVALTLILSSTAFQDGGSIPDKYTCQGQDVSPPLSWGGPPAGTQSIAVIVDDLDSPGRQFTHWVIFNIPPGTRELAEAVTGESHLPNGTSQGKNDFGKIGYGGPCPPSGKPHRYQFTLYALDESLNLVAGAVKNQVLDAMANHVIARGRLTGTYQW
jgi:Raf kinase inhibitor-like YbhB/YbcL family protein